MTVVDPEAPLGRKADGTPYKRRRRAVSTADAVALVAADDISRRSAFIGRLLLEARQEIARLESFASLLEGRA